MEKQKYYPSFSFSEGIDIQEMDKHYLLNAYKVSIKIEPNINNAEYVQHNLRELKSEIIRRMRKCETPICDVCGIEVVFNLHIYKITGLCGTCSTGEARLNYEED